MELGIIFPLNFQLLVTFASRAVFILVPYVYLQWDSPN